MKIRIVGNSVAIKIRPPRAGGVELTYSEIVARAGHEVTNVSMAGALLSEQFSLLDDDVITAFPDAVILHHGIIEVYFRRTFRAPNNAGIFNQYRNRVLRQGYTSATPSLLVRAFNALTRRIAGFLGLRWQWQSPAEFLRVVQLTCELILKETGAFIVVVGISPTSARAEAELPGLRAEIARVNGELRACAARLGGRIEFLDVASLLAAAGDADLIPDGIHFSAEGHRRVAASLLRIFESRAAT